MDLRELFITALMPVLEVLLITALGAFLALDRFDLLGEDAKKHLNNIGAIYMWSYAYNVVRIYSCPSKNSNADNKVDDSNMTPVSPSKSFESNKVNTAPEVDPENLHVCSTGPLVTKVDCTETNGHLNHLEVESGVPNGKSKGFTGTKLGKFMKGLKAIAQLLNLKVLLAPSTIGSFVGLVIGVVPEFRRMLVGDAAPLRVVQNSISMLGDAAIPSITLLVGANLLKGIKQKGTQVSLVVGIIVVRYIALPAFGVGIVKFAIHLGWISEDPIYRFILLLEYAVPPAINMGTITQIFGVGESECSVILLATYAVASVSLTLWCTFFMWLVL
ncbi:hypothetical protein L6164_005600 [Bauhinia variegata]|uniref:Uncharacterized protein n=1 Tax=Bauhinia variegata TaxID=167791 RepID=A0ACB9PR48_BAUVA|nr:hypothetical protein L6164_005600 [Bauhinia variegata]